jgi:hypothetical protein
MQEFGHQVGRKTKFCTLASNNLGRRHGTRFISKREERRLRVFESRVLKKVFWAKTDEVTVEWGKLHNEEFHD